MSRVDLTGQRFGRLVVLSLSSRTPKTTIWICRCDCGAEKTLRASNLKAGHSTSCGCSQREELAQRNRAGKWGRRHGHASNGTLSPEFRCWRSMIDRCDNPRNISYDRYGGRRIRVCERWRVFENFLTDMGGRPSLDHSIDRADNAGNYEPGNCRWATRIEQARNRSNNRRIAVGPLNLTMAEWAERTGITYEAITSRIARGWSEQRAVSVPRGGA